MLPCTLEFGKANDYPKSKSNVEMLPAAEVQDKQLESPVRH